MTDRKPFAHTLLTKDGAIYSARNFTEDGQYIYTAADIQVANLASPELAPFRGKLMYDMDESSVACVACNGLGYHEEGYCAGFEFGDGQLSVQSGMSNRGDDTGAVLIREALSPVSPNEPIPREAVGEAVLILKFPSYAQANAVANAIAMPKDQEQPQRISTMDEQKLIEHQLAQLEDEEQPPAHNFSNLPRKSKTPPPEVIAEVADALDRISNGALSDYEGRKVDEAFLRTAAKLLREIGS